MYRRQEHHFPADEPDSKRQRSDKIGTGSYHVNDRGGRKESKPTPRVELRYTPADELPKISHVSAELLNEIDLAQSTPGTLGTVDALITNYAYLTLPSENVHQYSIVTEKVGESQSDIGSSKAFNGMILNKLQRDKFPNLRYIFDGGDLIYSVDMFEPIETVIDGIKVTIKWVKNIPLSNLNHETSSVECSITPLDEKIGPSYHWKKSIQSCRQERCTPSTSVHTSWFQVNANSN